MPTVSTRHSIWPAPLPALPEPVRALGVDLGSRRVGLAMSDPARVLATPHSVLKRSKSRAHDHRAIAALVDEWEITTVVVGLPLSLDGSVGPAARDALAEAEALGVVTGVPVETYDERLTTVSAHHVLREQGVAGPDRKHVVDKVAAAILLQAWLDGQDRADPTPEPQ